MPNYCYNRINLNVTKEELEKIKEKVISIDEFGDEYFDFNKIIEKPKDVLSRSIGIYSIEAYSKYCYENPDRLSKKTIEGIINGNLYEIVVRGKVRKVDDYIRNKYSDEQLKNYDGKRLRLWYNWCIENWGTKWNSIFTVIEKDSIIFDTAWSPISLELFEGFIRLCEEIVGSKAKDIWLYYSEEGGFDISGRYYIEDNEIIHDTDYRENVA